MDAGEGWTWREGDSWWWHPSRIAVKFSIFESNDLPFVQADMRVVNSGNASDDLFALLSDLNTHAAGWWWWTAPEDGHIYCSQRCEAHASAWWWPSVLFDTLPYAVTVAESMADTLASVAEGSVDAQPHPERGVRAQVDGWIGGCRLGARDPTASLDLWFFDYERARMGHALDVLCGQATHEQFFPLQARIADVDHEPKVVLRRHWHPQLGWGWLFVTVTGLTALSDAGADLLRKTAGQLSREQAERRTPANRFGGWAYVDGPGLMHSTFVSAFAVDKITAAAGTSIGDVAALMIDVPTRFADLSRAVALSPEPGVAQSRVDGHLLETIQEMGWRAGPTGWSYIDPDGIPPTEVIADQGQWTDTSPQGLWTVPRHVPVCSFGFFNPMGPTVSSLEIGYSATEDGVQYTLYHVMRHPHLPEIRSLGDASTPDELAGLVGDALAEPEGGILGSGPEWLDIFALPDAVLAGVRRFAEGQGDADWGDAAAQLVAYALDPWARVADSDEQPVIPNADESDPVSAWIEAITDPVVIAGQRLFIRSAWEGAKEYRLSGWDPERAQQATDIARGMAVERLQAEVEESRAEASSD